MELSEIKEVRYEYNEDKVNKLLKDGWILLKITEESNGYASGREYILGKKV